jgi:hypothetical protein
LKISWIGAVVQQDVSAVVQQDVSEFNKCPARLDHHSEGIRNPQRDSADNIKQALQKIQDKNKQFKGKSDMQLTNDELLGLEVCHVVLCYFECIHFF